MATPCPCIIAVAQLWIHYLFTAPYNKFSFEPVTTSGLRLAVTLQPDFAAGIQEWKAK